MDFKNVGRFESKDGDSILENKFKDNLSIKANITFDNEDNLSKRYKFKKIL